MDDIHEDSMLLEENPKGDFKMTSRDRRTMPGKAIAVEIAIRIAAQDGLTAAVEYMYQNGITSDIALRVLSGPEFCRQHKERRQIVRSCVH